MRSNSQGYSKRAGEFLDNCPRIDMSSNRSFSTVFLVVYSTFSAVQYSEALFCFGFYQANCNNRYYCIVMILLSALYLCDRADSFERVRKRRALETHG